MLDPDCKILQAIRGRIGCLWQQLCLPAASHASLQDLALERNCFRCSGFTCQ